MLLTANWSINVLLYTHSKKVTRSVFEIKFSPRLLKALDIFSKSEVGLAVYFDLICTWCDQSYFFLQLYFCKNLCSQSQRVFWSLVWFVCQRKCVFLRGSRSLLWWLCVCNLVFDYLADTQRFLELDVALGIRVNQYKIACVILSLP